MQTPPHVRRPVWRLKVATDLGTNLVVLAPSAGVIKDLHGALYFLVLPQPYFTRAPVSISLAQRGYRCVLQALLKESMRAASLSLERSGAAPSDWRTWCTATTGCMPSMATTSCKVQSPALCSTMGGLLCSIPRQDEQDILTLKCSADVVNYNEDGAHIFASLQQDMVRGPTVHLLKILTVKCWAFHAD